MKTKKFLMVALAMLCAMTTTTVLSSCGDDKNDLMPTYAVYSHSDQTYGLYISGRILNYHLALYNAKVLYHLSEEEPTAEENLAYFINASIEKADSYISKTGGTPITNLSERDNQVIESYDYIFNKIPAESKALLKGKFEVYRSVNGGGMETIKTYLYE